MGELPHKQCGWNIGSTRRTPIPYDLLRGIFAGRCHYHHHTHTQEMLWMPGLEIEVCVLSSDSRGTDPSIFLRGLGSGFSGVWRGGGKDVRTYIHLFVSYRKIKHL